ncbi:MAG: hypothetical protein JO035_09035 [Betaproteobacteria bacterium]|nr:hypothetical protein [Betaproteobacteria bacterium]
MTRMLLLAAAFSSSLAIAAPPAQRDYPGYGVVQSITRLPAEEPSASAGASSPSKARQKAAYLVRVRMDDGRIQVREVRKREVKIGQRVLVTNAGDVLPE